MRGYQKRVVFVRNPNSRLFDEAYFVLREGEPMSLPDRDMVAEATRIIEGETSEGRQGDKQKRHRLRYILIGCGLFLCGVLTALCAVAWLA